MILNSEVELVIQLLKSGKTPGVDIIPREFIKWDGPIMKIIFRELSQQILETKVWPKSWTTNIKERKSKDIL